MALSQAVGFYVVSIFFVTQPAIPKIIEIMRSSNETQPAIFPFPVDYYGIDLDTYYYYILVHSYICVPTILTIIVAADTMFVVQIQHACGMFTVLGHQLERMADTIPDNNELDPRRKDDPVFRHLSICIRTHNKVIELGELLEESYTWALFTLVGLNMFLMTITGFQTVMTMDDSPRDALRYAASTMTQIVHLFFQSFFSQRLLDHSEQVREYVCQAEWYKASLSTQKLLNFITIRTYVPCRLTAGRIMVMSLESFSSVIKTSMSYLTILRSMQ